MFTGTSADQQRKDANIARYPPRSNLHAIKDSSEMPSKHDPIYVPLQEPILDDVDDSEEAHGLVPATEHDDYSFQDEAEGIASTTYDNIAVAEDFNFDNRGAIYDLDQKEYVQYCYETYVYPEDKMSSFNSITSPLSPSPEARQEADAMFPVRQAELLKR